MESPDRKIRLEEQIGEWRSFLRRRQAIHPVDVEELEDHLREQVSALLRANLTEDEAFLIAVKRLGDLDSLSREFAREHSERLWKQLVVSPDDAEESGGAKREAVVAFGLAVLAAIAFKIPELFGLSLDGDEGFYARNVSLFVFPLLAGFFVWKRRAGLATQRWLAAGFVSAAVFANIYPFRPEGSTEILTAMHLPIALWIVVGVAYAGGRWGEPGVRMD
ncbi:MAG: permease prefix domain 1-containing protein, partial [Gemmatimonadota bacterium]